MLEVIKCTAGADRTWGRYVLEIWERLRLAREEQGLELSDLEHRTRVRLRILTAIETGQFDELPTGLYARAVVRAYAQAVGLDPAAVLADVSPRLPAAEDPIDGLARVRGFEREIPKTEPRAGAASCETWPRIAAMLVDSAILAFIDLCLVASSAWLCGVGIRQLLQFAMPAMAMLSLLLAGVYFLMLGGVAGITPGMRVAGLAPIDSDRRVNVLAIASRAFQVILREASIFVELWDAVRRSAKTIDSKPAALEREGQLDGPIGDEKVEIVGRAESVRPLGAQRAEVPGR
jgi:hypothetical protein